MNFGFVENVKTTGRGSLAANKIHEVTFDGCELRTIESSKGVFEVVDLKFSNNEGVFTDSIFDPGDDVDTDGAFGKNPSAVKELALKIKHLLEAVYPENAAKVFQMQGDWNAIRKQIKGLTDPGKGVKTKIKLMGRASVDQAGNKQIYAQFPRYIAGYSRDGGLYLKTSFIGKNLYYTSKEMSQIQKTEAAAPTPVASTTATTPSSSNWDDLDI